MTKIYNYDQDSGVFLSESVADVDPLGTMPLIPAFATTIVPPELEDGEVAIFSGKKWEIKPAAAELPVSLPEKRKNMIAAVANKRFAIETGGLELPNGMRIGTDRADQAIITGAVSAVQFGIKSYDWKGADGAWITLTAEQITQIGAIVAGHVQGCFTAERKHCEIIGILADKELDDYDINTGWPA